jgi:hypothetical protein
VISREIDNDNIPIRALYLKQLLSRPVRGAVVDKYDFKGGSHLFKNTQHSAVKLTDAFLLIAARNNHTYRDSFAWLIALHAVFNGIICQRSSPCISGISALMQLFYPL